MRSYKDGCLPRVADLHDVGEPEVSLGLIIHAIAPITATCRPSPPRRSAPGRDGRYRECVRARVRSYKDGCLPRVADLHDVGEPEVSLGVIVHAIAPITATCRPSHLRRSAPGRDGRYRECVRARVRSYKDGCLPRVADLHDVGEPGVRWA
ncbi:hypothetical protein [Xanthomonas citri]|uniref:hypothetical protein n=1 Tax=Xanthomonas citri TaxID=346 RepID=UPI000F5B4CE7|nr:hypothetical protein [Xanthomonas citri]QDR45709.1 hypothetical protein FPK90_14310 [Xanthomonas citri pv. glycines]QDS07705.1 hypothetical protein FPL00_13235 [Xanthomonas citri pv. glycines]QDS12044.1 hypothetical protein FPL03_13490 [Xanthomonas citri pv. glycines]QTK33100.1 hypothetical protein XcgCFBP2526_13335 [Xanthomonas citri pv. glycines CFBP 2526]QTK37515.1 hypothetical protein XcgCFBP7119R_14075 [Xanthomonas citri pv. glycines]